MGILTDDMKRVVREQRLGFYATVRPDGTPNLSPKGTTAVWDDDHLAFVDLRSPQTIANLRTNPAIAVNVVDPIVRKGYRFTGTATVLESGDRYEEVVRMFERDRGIAPSRVRAIVLIEVTDARPLISPGYDDGTTEDEIKERWKSHYRDLHGPF